MSQLHTASSSCPVWSAWSFSQTIGSSSTTPARCVRASLHPACSATPPPGLPALPATQGARRARMSHACANAPHRTRTSQRSGDGESCGWGGPCRGKGLRERRPWRGPSRASTAPSGSAFRAGRRGAFFLSGARVCFGRDAHLTRDQRADPPAGPLAPEVAADVGQAARLDLTRRARRLPPSQVRRRLGGQQRRLFGLVARLAVKMAQQAVMVEHARARRRLAQHVDGLADELVGLRLRHRARRRVRALRRL
eukprot:3598335-Prymnesium_polylepis.1